MYAVDLLALEATLNLQEGRTKGGHRGCQPLLFLWLTLLCSRSRPACLLPLRPPNFADHRTDHLIGASLAHAHLDRRWY